MGNATACRRGDSSRVVANSLSSFPFIVTSGDPVKVMSALREMKNNFRG